MSRRMIGAALVATTLLASNAAPIMAATPLVALTLKPGSTDEPRLTAR